MLEAALRERTSSEWLRALAEADVPSAAVNDVEAALRDPQVQARASVIEIEHERLGPVRQIATPLRLSGEAPRVRRAPFRGEHTAQVLVELCGYDAARLDALTAAGVLGDGAAPDADVETEA